MGKMDRGTQALIFGILAFIMASSVLYLAVMVSNVDGLGAVATGLMAFQFLFGLLALLKGKEAADLGDGKGYTGIIIAVLSLVPLALTVLVRVMKS